MSIHLSKTLMVLLFCLTFVGQTMAATVMSYHMMAMDAQESTSQMSAMDHSSHNMASDAQIMTSEAITSEDMSEECCVMSCDCYTSGCSTVVALAKMFNNAAIENLATKISSPNRLAYNQVSSSLYRPPILS